MAAAVSIAAQREFAEQELVRAEGLTPRLVRMGIISADRAEREVSTLAAIVATLSHAEKIEAILGQVEMVPLRPVAFGLDRIVDIESVAQALNARVVRHG